MRVQQQTISKFTMAACLATAALFVFAVTPAAQAAISWDAEGGSRWWFNPVNWDTTSNVNNVLPPTDPDENEDGTLGDYEVIDTLINKLPAQYTADFNQD